MGSLLPNNEYIPIFEEYIISVKNNEVTIAAIRKSDLMNIIIKIDSSGNIINYAIQQNEKINTLYVIK